MLSSPPPCLRFFDASVAENPLEVLLGGVGGEDEKLRLNLRGGILGFKASSARRLQSWQTKWKSSRSASVLEMLWQALHFSQAMLWVPSSFKESVELRRHHMKPE